MCQETRAMDIRLVEIYPLVLWVQIWDFWLQPPCLYETQSRWTEDLCMCGSHHEAWRRRCDVALLVTLSDLFIIQGILNQDGYHSILQRCAIPIPIICFSTGQWPNTPPGCVRTIWPRRWFMECCIRWPGLLNHPTSTQMRCFGMSWTAEWSKSSSRLSGNQLHGRSWLLYVTSGLSCPFWGVILYLLWILPRQQLLFLRSKIRQLYSTNQKFGHTYSFKGFSFFVLFATL